jgi:hypothetical protein
MTQHITKSHLDFVQEAKEAFEKNSLLETYRNNHDHLIALRMGADRDCVLIYELGECIANFVQQMEPYPKPRKAVMEFAHDMEKQLRVNDHKCGWDSASYEFLSERILANSYSLYSEFSKEVKDKKEIAIRSANIANYAMMIADNEGEHL